MECLRQRIVDPNLLRLIGRFHKSGIMEEGIYYETDQGTPQGGILSPVLANIYLHYALDLWFEDEVKPQLTGYTPLIRYADDFVVCFEKEAEARAFGVALRRRMGEFGRCACTRAKRYGRKCETFDFLGFTHFCDKTRWGNFRMLQNFYHQVVRLAFKWVNRRSQRKSYNWAQFLRYFCRDHNINNIGLFG